MKEPTIFIKHILENIGDIESFSKELSKDKFMKSKLRQNAIIRCIEIIGEAVKNLSKGFTAKYPNIEWDKIAGARDKMVHHYFGVDLDLVWEIVKNDLPKLKKDINEILKDLEA